MKLFINGRRKTFDKLRAIQQSDKVVWIHAASLGEFEQGRPIIETIKKTHPQYKIVLTFFSPSGYEIRKNYDLADVICYLPFDTPSNVKKFIRQVHPDLAMIVKYEFWPNLLNELTRTNTETILVSGIFRENHIFFKPYGTWMRKSLTAFNHFFVQNKTSQELLHTIGFNNVTISGDTRFDRVYKILQQDNSLDFIEQFKDGTYTVVAGSTWCEDEALLINYINKKASEDEKFIIAPHNVKRKNIEELKNILHKKTVVFSEKEQKNLSDYQVFIIDTIGILTKIYSYADVAYVGGGLKTGLHNILEPATFGIPVVFGGKKYQKFQEAVDLVALSGCNLVSSQEEFYSIFATLKANEAMRKSAGKINSNYITNNLGATRIICNYINLHL